MNVRYISGSWKGKERNSNKDKIFIIENDSHMLFMVFDGVSSTSDALSTINKAFAYIQDSFQSTDDIENNLPHIIYGANTYALEEAPGDGASTLVALLHNKQTQDIFTSHLGDSRIYEINDNSLQQITKDDSLVSESHIITKGIGFVDLKREDCYIQEIVQKSAKYLLCTDGFYEVIEMHPKEALEPCFFKRQKNSEQRFMKTIPKYNTDDATYILLEIK